MKKCAKLSVYKNYLPSGQELQKQHRRFAMFFLLTLAMLIVVVLYQQIILTDSNEVSFREKAFAMGLQNWPEETARKHISISENVDKAYNHPNFTPVHVMYRTNESSQWMFSGTGTIMNRLHNKLLTSRSVFEPINCQYGVRVIGNREFSGDCITYPIISYEELYSGSDIGMCTFDQVTKKFPILRVPRSLPATFNPHTSESENELTVASSKINLLTYPESSSVDAIFWTEIKPGVWNVVMNYDISEGEFGTGAVIEGQESRLLILTGVFELDDRTLSVSKEMKRGLSRDKKYTIATVFKFE